MESPHQKLRADIRSMGQIENVAETTRALLWKKYKGKTILVLVISLFLMFLHPVLPIVMLISFYQYVKLQAFAEFMRQFAESNGLIYKATVPANTTRGRLFKTGRSMPLKHVVSGTYESHPMRIFHYSYSVGSGKSRRTYPFTVFEVEFPKTVFPYILLQSTTMAKFGSGFVPDAKNDCEIPLEDEFKKSFKLFATEGYEIEVFEIFTKEVLLFLQQKSSQFSIEFAENRMYIYDDLYISRRAELIEMYEVARSIFTTLGPLLNRMHDDFSALHTYYKEGTSTQK